MTRSERPQAPVLDYEYLHDQVGCRYDFQSVWSEDESRWFVEIIRIQDAES